eukprot:scaffold12703_cov101-Isochrysis_galbana.AAC.7
MPVTMIMARAPKLPSFTPGPWTVRNYYTISDGPTSQHSSSQRHSKTQQRPTATKRLGFRHVTPPPAKGGLNKEKRWEQNEKWAGQCVGPAKSGPGELLLAASI